MISLLCPTRGRPKEFERMVSSFRNCTIDQPIEVVAMLDNDDPEFDNYNHELINQRISDETTRGKVDMWNVLAGASKGEYMMMVNDDNICNTYGWDWRFTRVKPDDNIFIAWPNGQGAQCVNPIISRRLYNALGYFVPSGFNWWYADTALHSLGAYMGRLCYLPDVTVLSTAHKEQVAGDIKVDQDISRFHEWKRNERRKDAEKVWALMS